jgi:hypothetical protein
MILSYNSNATIPGGLFVLGGYCILASLFGRGFNLVPLQRDFIGKRTGVGSAKVIYICLGAVFIVFAFVLKDRI